jgi:hypothetical protein
MPQSPSWTDIAAIASIIALVVSIYTLFVTRLKWFKGVVIPSRRIALTWVTGGAADIPCIFVECQFINQGVKPGKIEDVIVELQNTDGGDRLPYLAFLVRNEAVDVYVEEGEREQTLRDFSTVWLKPDENKNISIFFKSSRTEIVLTANNTYRLSLLYTGDNVFRMVSWKILKWKVSPVHFSFRVSEAALQEWKNGQTVRLESAELEENRKEIFRHRDSF